MPTRTATCACGAVEIALDGPPIATLSCCCDDCQAAARELETLPGAPAFREPCGGTAAALFPKAALKVTRGRDKLTAWNETLGALAGQTLIVEGLTERSATERADLLSLLSLLASRHDAGRCADPRGGYGGGKENRYMPAQPPETRRAGLNAAPQDTCQ